MIEPNENIKNKSDQNLMRMIVDSNHQAFRVLYRRYELPIFNFILRYVGNKELSQDLLQETFTRVWFAAHSFNMEKGYFKGWIFKIALNITRSEMAKKRYGFSYIDVTEMNSTEKNLIQAVSEQPDRKIENLELQEKIQQALLRLQPFLREVIILKHFQQLKFREIAQITDTPEGTLKSRFHRAIGLLREYLTQVDRDYAASN